jgi:uncharacterized membrane protein YdbT with pleckstrin-like domain
MKKVFPSKVDSALPILFVVTSIPAIVIGVREQDWMVFVVMIATFGLVMYLLYDTNYTITEGNLKVHSGFIVNKNIPIATIQSVKKTDSLMSSPASSLSDRIEVFYGNKKSVIISPKDRKEFLNELLKQNTEIKIEF